MYQDSKGLLYISTFGGLSVYDGVRFTNYTTDNGLAADLVNDVLEVGEDSLWIVPNYPSLHSLVKGKIHNVITSDSFYPVTNKMIHCNNGSFYSCADQGLFRFENNHFRKISLMDSAGREASQFMLTGKEIDGKLFLLTDPNIHAFPGDGHLVVYDYIKNTVAVSEDISIYGVIQDAEGTILVGTSVGIRQLDKIALAKNVVKLLPAPSVYKSVEDAIVTDLYFDRQGNFWLPTLKGVIKKGPLGGVTIYSLQNGLPVNLCTSVFQDNENTMWFTNEQTGISKLSNLRFEFYPQLTKGFITSDLFASEKSDSVWFLDGKHNKVLLQSKNILKEFNLGAGPNPPYRTIAADGDKCYLGSIFHAYKTSFTPEGKNQVTAMTFGDSSFRVGLNYILPDPKGNLLTSSGDVTVLLQNKKAITYPLGYFADHFALTPDNHLWVSARNHKIFLFRIHPEDPDHYFEFLHVYDQELPPMGPRSIAVDKAGNVWVGSRDHGICIVYLDGLKVKSWKQITTKDGLSDNFVTFLHCDKENNMWACTPGGLDKIQVRDGTLSLENITRGNNMYQYIYKIMDDKSGTHWALTSEGVIRIAPGENDEHDYQPKILFREINEGRNRIADVNKPASLSYRQNNLSFTIAAPSFIDEKQTRYSYLLQGSANAAWSDPSSKATINFDNLSPGKYTLQVKAIFINGLYPDSAISYSFVISPPWWQTWWVRLIIGILLSVFLGLLVRGYYQRKLTQQKMILEKQQAIEKERTRIAIDMHDDLGAGLSTIRFLGEKVKRNSFSQVTKEDIDKLQITSTELIDKMNEIIWAINEKNDSLEDLLFYTRSYAVEYCEDNNLECNICLPGKIPVKVVSGEVRRNVFLTVKESLHNIVKHSGANTVAITVDTADSLSIRISDNGRGFSENGKSTGGNGLRNMQKRMLSIGGDITVENNNGVTINMQVPLA